MEEGFGSHGHRDADGGRKSHYDHAMNAQTLLGPGEPGAYTTIGRPNGTPFLVVCDHASNRVPSRLGTLGVCDAERQRHIAWDIGAAGVARRLAAQLGAFAILQNYSRLVIDCNRDPAVPTSIAPISELTEIPGNLALTPDARQARVQAIFRPYHDRIAAELDRRRDAGIPTVLVSVHSFTPVYKGEARPWQVGLLYNRDPRVARLMMALLAEEGGLTIGDNQPYSVSDETDYTIPVHGERRGLPYAEIEIRQDLIAGDAGQDAWAARLARILVRTWSLLGAHGAG
jgi:predicted N-formylglutamate amidohydrolase